MKPRSAPIQFRVYIGPREGSGLYLQARVFATRRAMLAALSNPELNFRLPRTMQAVMETTLSWRDTPRGRRLEPCLGRVNFYRQGLRLAVVAHEFAHAMFTWADRKHLLRPRRDLENGRAALPCARAHAGALRAAGAPFGFALAALGPPGAPAAGDTGAPATKITHTGPLQIHLLTIY